MKKMLKHYFSHSYNYYYFVMGIASLYFIVSKGYLQHYWYIPFITIVVSPFYEWFAHKFLLHREIKPSDKFWYAYQKRLHYDHHLRPDSIREIFAPFTAAVAVFLQIFLLFSLIFWSFSAGFVGMTSAIFYFLYYEWVHLGHHVPGYDHFTPYGRFMKKAHMWHHFSYDNAWWGITSHVGDAVLGTFPDVKKTEHRHFLKEWGRYPIA